MSKYSKYYYDKRGVFIGKNGEKINKLTGFLDNIEYKEETIYTHHGEDSFVSKNWQTTFIDKYGDKFVWTSNAIGVPFQNFVNSVLTLDEISNTLLTVKISLKAGKWSNIKVFNDETNESLGWLYDAEELPPIKQAVKDGYPVLDENGRAVYDKTARQEWVNMAVEKIKEKLNDEKKAEEEVTATDDVPPSVDVKAEDDDEELPF